MPTLANENPEKIFALFKGEPSTRKSTQALSFPLPQYWFSWDRKMNGILVPARKWGIDMSKVSYDDYDSWSDPKKSAKKKLEELALNCPYATLVFDSVTSMADMTLRQTLKMKGGMTRQSGQAAGKMIAGIAVNEMEDYNAESSALGELIYLAKDIQDYQYSQGKIVNIILIAHVMEVSKPEGQKTTYVRTIVTAGKRVAAKIPAYCSETYHFDIEASVVEGGEGDYIVYTENTGTDFARTALDLPKKITFKDNKQLYRDYVKPAIDKLKKPTTDITV